MRNFEAKTISNPSSTFYFAGKEREGVSNVGTGSDLVRLGWLLAAATAGRQGSLVPLPGIP